MAWLSERLAHPPLVPIGTSHSCDGVIHARLICVGNGDLLAGHYPGDPITPAICLVDAAACIVAATGRSGEQGARDAAPMALSGLKGLRLFRKIVPGDIVDLTLTAVAGYGAWRVDADVAGARAARCSIVFDAAAPLASAPPPMRGVAIGAEELLRILPHRCPMLLVDRAERGTTGEIVGYYRVSANAPWFAHLPRTTTMARWSLPRVLAIESFLQSAGLVFTGDRAENATLIVSAIGDAAFLGDTGIGDVLTHQVTIARLFDAAALVGGITLCGDRIVARYDQVLVALQPCAASVAASRWTRPTIATATGIAA